MWQKSGFIKRELAMTFTGTIVKELLRLVNSHLESNRIGAICGPQDNPRSVADGPGSDSALGVSRQQGTRLAEAGQATVS